LLQINEVVLLFDIAVSQRHRFEKILEDEGLNEFVDGKEKKNILADLSQVRMLVLSAALDNPSLFFFSWNHEVCWNPRASMMASSTLSTGP
jgi:hypothetical protein